MCRVKEGAEIKTAADLQNLVTSVILRQNKPFSIQDVCCRIIDKAIGSKLNNEEEIRKRCYETISALYLIDCINSMGDDEYKLTMTFPSTNK